MERSKAEKAQPSSGYFIRRDKIPANRWAQAEGMRGCAVYLFSVQTGTVTDQQDLETGVIPSYPA
jgi:hypothetical protein